MRRNGRLHEADLTALRVAYSSGHVCVCVCVYAFQRLLQLPFETCTPAEPRNGAQPPRPPTRLFRAFIVTNQLCKGTHCHRNYNQIIRLLPAQTSWSISILVSDFQIIPTICLYIVVKKRTIHRPNQILGTIATLSWTHHDLKLQIICKNINFQITFNLFDSQSDFPFGSEFTCYYFKRVSYSCFSSIIIIISESVAIRFFYGECENAREFHIKTKHVSMTETKLFPPKWCENITSLFSTFDASLLCCGNSKFRKKKNDAPFLFFTIYSRYSKLYPLSTFTEANDLFVLKWFELNATRCASEHEVIQVFSSFRKLIKVQLWDSQ